MTVKKCHDEMLYIVTTTAVPYLWHVPAILGTPSGVPYWFRYLSKYLHANLRERALSRIPRAGMLFIRDENSSDKLCFPLRRFDVLWFERNETVSFLNLLMGPLFAYVSAPAPDSLDAAAPQNAHAASWDLLIKHLCEFRNKHPCASPRTIAVPQTDSMPITPWASLMPPGGESPLLWLGRNANIYSESAQSERDKWRHMLPIFAAMEKMNAAPFIFIDRLSSVRSRYGKRPRQIGKDPHALHTHGFPLYPLEAYRLRVDQITPSAFIADAPLNKPFRLSLGESESSIRPTVDNVMVDGPHGFYELGFDIDPARSGTYALLRISAHDLMLPDTSQGSMSLPSVEIPIQILYRWRRSMTYGFLSFLAILAFVAAEQWMPTVGLSPESVAGKMIQALLFGLAILFGNKAGIGDLTSGVGKKA